MDKRQSIDLAVDIRWGSSSRVSLHLLTRSKPTVISGVFADLPLRFSSPVIESPAFLKDGQMKRARFTEDQTIGVLKGQEAGAKTADLARKHGVSEATLYNWKSKYGGMDISEAKRLKQLEDENAKLKKLLAEPMLDAAALRELLSKKW